MQTSTHRSKYPNHRYKTSIETSQAYTTTSTCKTTHQHQQTSAAKETESTSVVTSSSPTLHTHAADNTCSKYQTNTLTRPKSLPASQPAYQCNLTLPAGGVVLGWVARTRVDDLSLTSYKSVLPSSRTHRTRPVPPVGPGAQGHGPVDLMGAMEGADIAAED